MNDRPRSSTRESDPLLLHHRRAYREDARFTLGQRLAATVASTPRRRRPLPAWPSPADHRATSRSSLRRPPPRLPLEHQRPDGSSKEVQHEVERLVRRVADVRAPVLAVGAQGVGHQVHEAPIRS